MKKDCNVQPFSLKCKIVNSVTLKVINLLNVEIYKLSF